MKNVRILINASNLHVGGGVQVAVSLIDEMSRMAELPHELAVMVSSEVHKNLMRIESDVSRFDCYIVRNAFGISALWSKLGRIIRKYDVVYTIFGPLYLVSISAVSIVGFAQPWIARMDNEVYRRKGLLDRLMIRMKFGIQEFFFRRSDKLIVELEHVKKALVTVRNFDGKKIDVVNNCISSLYFSPERWASLENLKRGHGFAIGFVGRDYEHKNTEIFPEIRDFLLREYGLSVDFYVTFSEEEWRRKSIHFRSSVLNVGLLDVAQCPTFYQKMDAVIFPSLLECFSATPIEAMVMRKALFASDRPFVRDVCGDFAWYFDPESPAAAARLIADYIKNRAGCDRERLDLARSHVLRFSNAAKRAAESVRIIHEMASAC